MKYYDNITNNFPGGLFKYVREVSLYDERPFEHEFFLRIAQSFPFMKKLTIKNRNHKITNNVENQTMTIKIYQSLNILILLNLILYRCS